MVGGDQLGAVGREAQSAAEFPLTDAGSRRAAIDLSQHAATENIKNHGNSLGALEAAGRVFSVRRVHQRAADATGLLKVGPSQQPDVVVSRIHCEANMLMLIAKRDESTAG